MRTLRGNGKVSIPKGPALVCHACNGVRYLDCRKYACISLERRQKSSDYEEIKHHGLFLWLRIRRRGLYFSNLWHKRVLYDLLEEYIDHFLLHQDLNKAQNLTNSSRKCSMPLGQVTST